MAILTIKLNNMSTHYQELESYTVDTDRKFGGFEIGDMICHICPFLGVPLQLEMAIRKDGTLHFRAWTWVQECNSYLHTREVAQSENPFVRPFEATQEQRDTVAGLVSGRIKFEGLKLAVGKTVLDVTKPDFDAEEKRTGKQMYFA